VSDPKPVFAHVKGFLSANLQLLAIPLLRFEVTNALWKAISRGRAELSNAQLALREFEAFNLPEREVATQDILTTARIYCSNPTTVE